MMDYNNKTTETTGYSEIVSNANGNTSSGKTSNGYYQAMWEARKRDLKFTLILSTIIAVALSFIIVYTMEDDAADAIWEFFLLLLLFFACTFPCIMIFRSLAVRSSGVAAGAFGIGLIAGLFGLALSGGLSGASTFIILRFFVFAFFAMIGIIVFLVIAGVNLFYIPISDIYYFVKAKQEKVAA